MKNKYRTLSPLALTALRLSKLTTYPNEACIICLPDEQLPRKVYTELKTALSTFDGRWDSKQKSFVLPSGTASFIHEACTSGNVFKRRQTFQEFFTPPPLAKVMASIILNHRNVSSILEPSAGSGALVNALFDAAKRDYRLIKVTAVEIQPENINKMTCYAMLNTVPHDFLTWKPGTEFDAVCMNPPFANSEWAKHVNRALKFLKPNGILVAVVPASANESQINETCVLESVDAKFEHTDVKIKLLIAIKGEVSPCAIMRATDYSSRHGERLVNSDGSDNLPPKLSPRPTKRSLDSCLKQIRESVATIGRQLDELAHYTK